MSRRVLICRISGAEEWKIVSNPSFKEPNAEYFASRILENGVVDYVEYNNCGTVCRVIRPSKLKEYGL